MQRILLAIAGAAAFCAAVTFLLQVAISRGLPATDIVLVTASATLLLSVAAAAFAYRAFNRANRRRRRTRAADPFDGCRDQGCFAARRSRRGQARAISTPLSRAGSRRFRPGSRQAKRARCRGDERAAGLRAAPAGSQGQAGPGRAAAPRCAGGAGRRSRAAAHGGRRTGRSQPAADHRRRTRRGRRFRGAFPHPARGRKAGRYQAPSAARCRTSIRPPSNAWRWFRRPRPPGDGLGDISERMPLARRRSPRPCSRTSWSSPPCSTSSGCIRRSRNRSSCRCRPNSWNPASIRRRSSSSSGLDIRFAAEDWTGSQDGTGQDEAGRVGVREARRRPASRPRKGRARARPTARRSSKWPPTPAST